MGRGGEGRGGEGRGGEGRGGEGRGGEGRGDGWLRYLSISPRFDTFVMSTR